MIEIARTYLHVEYPPCTRDQLTHLANAAYDIAESVIRDHFREYFSIEDIELRATVEEGSIKSKIVVGLAGLHFLYQAISGYGSFRQGIDTFARDVQKAGRAINELQLDQLKRDRSDVIRNRSGSGLPGKLSRLFQEVAAGRLSADDAMKKVDKLLAQRKERLPDQILPELLKPVQEPSALS
ncbi:MAG: hypothetical protein ABSC55_23765 [Syntrophorhabdales bacterium]